MGRALKHIDWIDILILGCLGAFGLSILLSISTTLATQQFFYMLLATILILGTVNLEVSVLVLFAPLGYLIALGLLVMSYFGPVIRGATRWIIVAGIQLQPSELVKPLLLLSFAWFMTRFPPKNFRNTAMHLGVFLVPFLLVYKQPDLGSALVYASFWLAMMIASGFPFRIFLMLVLVVGILTPTVWGSFHNYQQARILTFLNPQLDPRGAGYNALQAMIAVGSGKFLGRGLGRGTQSHLRFLPEFHTDFIFATLVEEFGFFGGLMLLAGYGSLLWRIVRPLIRGVVDEIFPFVYSIGLFAMMLSQIFINTGMNMGIIPITGITLPFVSYGGSSILSISIAFGMLWVFRQASRNRPRVADIA